MNEAQAQRWCAQNLHVRDTETGVCLECGDYKDPVAESEELRANEPPPASIVLASGPTGTAWQRHRDGWWHSTTGKRASWPRLMMADRPGSRTRLVYLPPFAPDLHTEIKGSAKEAGKAWGGDG